MRTSLHEESKISKSWKTNTRPSFFLPTLFRVSWRIQLSWSKGVTSIFSRLFGNFLEAERHRFLRLQSERAKSGPYPLNVCVFDYRSPSENGIPCFWIINSNTGTLLSFFLSSSSSSTYHLFLPSPHSLRIPLVSPPLNSVHMRFTSSFILSVSLLLSSQVQAFPSFNSNELSSNNIIPFSKRDSIPDPLAGKRSPARDFSLIRRKRALKSVPDADHPYKAPRSGDQRS